LSQGIELLPSPTVHPDFAAPPALPVSDLDRAPDPVQIALGQRERFADPQPGAPQHDDHAAEPDPVGVIPGGAHDGDDLLDRWRVRRIAQSFVAGRAALVVARKRRRRPGPASAVHVWSGFHDVLLRTMVDHTIVPRSSMIRARVLRARPRARFSRKARAGALGTRRIFPWQSERAARETSQPKAGVRRDGVDAARTLLRCTRRGRELTRREVIALMTEQQ
jgi:hypothetical protein